MLVWNPHQDTITINEPENTKGRKPMHTLAGLSDFPTTRWTLVIAAADPQRKEARSALVSLCEGYWYPLYAYVRRRGYPVDHAQDLTQEFFIRVLKGQYIDRAEP
jgi:RNA polymerase sigma-70 factor (ECF subfamily)